MLSETNAKYWRTYCAPHLYWLRAHMSWLRGLAMRDYEKEFATHAAMLGVGSEHFASSLYQEHQNRYGLASLEVQLGTWSRERTALLNHLSRFVDFEPADQPYHLRTSPVIDHFVSFGAGASNHCKGDLAPFEDKLKSLGFHTTVYWMKKESHFTLWGNCFPWMYDAACRHISTNDALQSYVNRGLSPKAYSLKEFLP